MTKTKELGQPTGPREVGLKTAGSCNPVARWKACDNLSTSLCEGLQWLLDFCDHVFIRINCANETANTAEAVG